MLCQNCEQRITWHMYDEWEDDEGSIVCDSRFQPLPFFYPIEHYPYH